jgi:hypothetical protein
VNFHVLLLHKSGSRSRRGRRVTCRLSHVRESKERHGFRSSKMSPFVPIFIVSPPVYLHTALLDDFFWRSFLYTQAEATRVFRTCGESSPLSKDTSRVCAEISTCFIRRVPDPRRVRKEAFTCRHRLMGLYQASTILRYIVLARRMSSTLSKKDLPEEGNR